MPTEEKKVLPFKLGADPEFNYTFQQKRIIAQTLLKNAFKGKREANMGYLIGNAGNLGWDGNSATAEIRPNPSEEPKQLVKNIGKLLAAASKPAKLFQLSTLSNSAPVGGHVHFELKENSSDLSRAQLINIHKKLATYFLPLMMGENKINLRLRMNQNYGTMKDGRSENGITYEFRTPSAEWLTTPKICEGTICFLGALWHEIIANPSTFTKDPIIYKTEKQGMAIQEMIISDYNPMADMLLGQIKRSVKKFEFYETFKEQIDYIMNPNKVLADKERCGYNIKVGWAFPDEGKVPSKRELVNKKQTIKRLQGMDVDSMLRLINIPMNQDTNVNIFTQELKKLIIAYGWNLKNNYHVFGLKDGIPGYTIMNFDGEFAKGSFENTLDKCVTRDDFSAIKSTMVRMKDRLISSRAASTEPKRNFIIGLNYTDRIKEDSKQFIDIIHSLEKETYKVEPISQTTFSSDSAGELYNIYNKAPDSDEPMIEENSRFTQMRDSEIRDEDEDYSKMSKAMADHVVQYITRCSDEGEEPSLEGQMHWMASKNLINPKNLKAYVRNHNENLKG